ncbi:heavy-metal-associated domain-containing protein [Arthrobacter sp. NEB 688]|uniref:heavy-metal-associated domain-containing protein n=1 Tax=Arthrobacter sp. NEB 688 TaxID=904039 RepID=UPI0015634429|nr:heavy-metal-associated domain-containing protein [Arthrobacter sp. NEB 688]QKE83565.1 heavy-metal-associated domain-containing protein [Arthrobacter sp. NEB 688]
MPSTQQFRATGLTCGHCAHAVTEELTALDGVDEVAVEVVSGGESLVTVTGRGLTDAEVAAALDEAGDYALVTG